MGTYYDVIDSISGKLYLHCVSKSEIKEMFELDANDLESVVRHGSVINYKYIIKDCIIAMNI